MNMEMIQDGYLLGKLDNNKRTITIIVSPTGTNT